MATGRETLIPAWDRSQLIELFREGIKEGASAKAIADLIGICSRTLRRWGIAFQTHGFSQDCRKGSPRNVAHRFTSEERQHLGPPEKVKTSPRATKWAGLTESTFIPSPPG